MDMPNETETSEATAADPAPLGERTWDEIQRIFVEWANAARMADDLAAERVEQEFRPVALAYAALPADGGAVTTGRRAIVRSIVTKLGGPSCTAVLATLDAVIAREEAAAMRDAQLDVDRP